MSDIFLHFAGIIMLILAYIIDIITLNKFNTHKRVIEFYFKNNYYE